MPYMCLMSSSVQALSALKSCETNNDTYIAQIRKVQQMRETVILPSVTVFMGIDHGGETGGQVIQHLE